MWVSYHIFLLSQPGDQVLRGLVLPAIRDLWKRQRFLRFFFIRYGEGGPHIRLRFLCSPEDKDEIETILKLRAADFFGLGDVSGRMIEFPFVPETERYGGAEFIGHSLDFFCLTSTYVLQQLESNRSLERSKLLAVALRVLVRQTAGFAADENEIASLAAYAVNGEWQRFPPLEARADREFEGQMQDYVRLFIEEVECSLGSQACLRLADTMITDGALLLSQQIRSASGPVRWRILTSQLHMTWNRMGIRNLEEIYLGRILWRSVRHVIDSNDSLRSSLVETLTRTRFRYKDDFETLISTSLSHMGRAARA